MSNLDLKQICLGVVVYDDWQNADALLKSLNETGVLSQFGEIIILDNNSSEQPGPELRVFCDQLSVRFFSSPENNMGRARSIVVDKTRSQYLLFLDADTRPTKDWVDGLLRAKTLLDQNRDWAGVGGTNFCSGKSLFMKGLKAAIDHPFVNGRSSQLRSVDALTDVQNLSTCNVLFRVEHLHLVGNFSSFYRLTGEDLEMSCRIIKSRKKLKMMPGFDVHHVYPESYFLLAKKFSKWGRAQFTVFFKHPIQMKSLLFKILLTGGFACFAFFLTRTFLQALIASEILFFISLSFPFRLRWRAFVFAHFIWFFYSLGIFYGGLRDQLRARQ